MSNEVNHPAGRLIEATAGRRLWVERDGAGEPVLLLSGLGPAGSHVIFHPHLDSLAEDHEVIYLDLYARGRSEAPADLREITFATDVADVAAVIERLGVGPVHLYGFSYGGLLGQAVALEHPELVRSLVLANTLHSPEMWQLNHANINRELAAQFPEVWERILALRAAGVRSTDPELQREFAAAVKLVRFYNPDNAALLATEPGARNVELYPLFCGDDVDFVIGGEVARIPDFRPRLRGLTVPLMLLAGRYDRALYPELQRDFVRFAPGARFEVLERSGSFGHVEEATAVKDLLRDFWARVTSGSTL
ncbi:tricorn interacting aminopeptidase F1 [Kribbella voronezhensis]|uniref:Tricorn interacting aminopeptidase F1 n=1 Tax=Kribbella voronezhensis TaxID=2512212 RepID=A0A4R7THM9_9ACTN|nr:alpha/beta hydrolase [Kribbella voronezhensis]TDU90997.1 tricorn interacting aminopeptidase F1 [Kribbella voronezhensis]